MTWTHNFPRYDGGGEQTRLEKIAQQKILPRFIPIDEFMPTGHPLWMTNFKDSGICTPMLIDSKLKDFSLDNLRFLWKGSENPSHYWSF